MSKIASSNGRDERRAEATLRDCLVLAVSFSWPMNYVVCLARDVQGANANNASYRELAGHGRTKPLPSYCHPRSCVEHFRTTDKTGVQRL